MTDSSSQPDPSSQPTPASYSSSQPTPASHWLGGETPRTLARTSDEVAGVGLGVGKKDRASLKIKDKKSYYKVRDNAIEGMKTKFTHLKAIDEKASVEHFEAVYSVITRFEDLSNQMIKNDMIDVFSIPSSFVLNSSNNYVPSPSATPMKLFSDANKIDLDTVRRANEYYIKFGADYHGENVVWSGEKILNSCDTDLRDKLVECTRNWPEEHKGGPTYLKLLLSLVLSTTEKSLRSLTDKLSKLSITDFPGENVMKAVSFIRGVVLILRDNQSLPSDLISLALRIFKASTCDVFKLHVTNMDSLVELGVKTYDLDTLLTNLDQKYLELLGRSEWTPTSTPKGQGSSFLADGSSENILKIICFNCGGIGHGTNNCTKPLNDTEINLRKEIMSNYGQSGSTNRKKSDKSSYTRNGTKRDPTKIPPRRNEPHEKVIDGVKKFWCGKPGCRAWTDHSSSQHVDANLADTGTEGSSSDTLPNSATSDSASIATNEECANSAYISGESIYHFG
jgi:hypothetical protein